MSQPKMIPINKRFQVQFEFPCEDPLNNVRVILRKGIPTFVVPINHPIAHHMGLTELVHAVQHRESLDLSTDLNNTPSAKLGRAILSGHRLVDELVQEVVNHPTCGPFNSTEPLVQPPTQLPK